ncbi:PREDICTED: kinesin-like protein KIFC3 [Pygoscelis adeliae]|uniref:kinesin-like protein KIFC3 n=1 Tax=Pygoscelis adeliae TaxID=9238 RepID=UPI0004F4DA75|nr:PREDICTED: kinesin-like protein KIFC3 [Pygoscelis adeliae]
MAGPRLEPDPAAKESLSPPESRMQLEMLEVETLTAKLLEQAQEIGRLRSELENAGLQERLSQLQREAEETRVKLAELDLEVQQKTNRLAEVELRLKDSLAERAEEEERLSRRLRDSQETIASLKSQPQQIKYIIKTVEVESAKAKQALCESQSRNQYLQEQVGMQRQVLKEMEQQLQSSQKTAAQLRAQQGNIRVFGRVRPLTKEDGEGPEAANAVTFDADDDAVLHLLHKGKQVSFELDKVFPPQASQEEVFQEVQALVTSCIDGYNVCIFAYGQTGAGKTYTMEVNLPGFALLPRLPIPCRPREAQHINKSLSALGDVIYALRSRQGHVPFRNSKLTYLLQDSLSGDSKTLMMVQVSPAEKNTSETLCSLKFAERVRSVELGPISRKAELASWPSQEQLEGDSPGTAAPSGRGHPSSSPGQLSGRATSIRRKLQTSGKLRPVPV